MSTQWSGSTAVSTTNLNKAIMGDSNMSGGQLFGFKIESDGLGSGSSSFTISGPGDENVSASAYNDTSKAVTIAISGKTLAAAGTVPVAIGKDAEICQVVCTFDSGDLLVRIFDYAGTVIDWDDNAYSIYMLLLTTA